MGDVRSKAMDGGGSGGGGEEGEREDEGRVVKLQHHTTVSV